MLNEFNSDIFKWKRVIVLSIKKELQEIIKKSLEKAEIDVNLKEVPKQKENGDYSTNVALTLTKQLKKSPMEIAEEIKSNIKNENIKKIEIAKPGFINMFLNEERYYQELNKILKEKKDYGKSNIGNNKKVNIEYVSANPTGYLHIGHGRGAAYGDSLSRIMNYTGYDVTREFYVNDAGNQMNNLGISIKERYKEICGLPFEIPEDGYHGKEIILLAQKIYDKNKDTKLNEDIEFFKQEGLTVLLKQIKIDLDKYRVNFDVFTSEQSLHNRGMIEKVLDTYKKNDECYIEDNALWLKTSNHGDDKDRVIIKSDGNYTYIVPDIAYHIDKIERGFEELIDVLGADHHGYQRRLRAALEMLGYDSNILNIELLQMVRLLKEGEEIKISKRTGKTITLNDLIDEVGVNATRYFFISKSLDTQMDFDITLAQKNSADNPVYYIEYANARISKILRTYKEKIETKEKYETIKDPLAYTIMNHLMNFEDTVIISSKKREPHIICNYIYELATLFHAYYNKEKFITEDKNYTNDRIVLLKAIKIVLNNSLDLLGIIPREEM